MLEVGGGALDDARQRMNNGYGVHDPFVLVDVTCVLLFGLSLLRWKWDEHQQEALLAVSWSPIPSILELTLLRT